ncbi:S-layer homology domain-containing protein, partial [Acutalibacter muris]|uniref:S-layer homology domain-containing protein n=2 Tax=Acutalibacter muris TaxID=1796620 RepID=UPI001C3FE90D
IKLRIIPKSGDPVDYPLTISVSERSASSNTGIDSIESTRIVGARIEGRDITIVKPVGTTSDKDVLGLKAENFKLAGAGATVDFTVKAHTVSGATQNVIEKVTVTAEDKSTKTYDVHYEIEPIFNTFTLKDIEVVDYSEVEDGITGNEYEGTGKKIVTVKVPFNAFDDLLIPSFTTSEQVIKVTSKAITGGNDSFTHGDGVLFDKYVGTTSGVAVWAYGANNAEANTPPKVTHKNGENFKFDVQTNVSSLYDNNASDANTGEITVKFIPVKNTKAELTGVDVGNANGADTYSQGIVKIDSTNASVIVGEIPNKNLEDTDNNKDNPRVVELTTRDVELHVSTNATVTILNPDGLNEDDSNVISDYKDDTKAAEIYAGTSEPMIKSSDIKNPDGIADNDGIVVLSNVNLRKYHSTPMRILVTSEDGSTNTEYRVNFNGTPEGKAEIKTVTLHGKAGTAAAGTTVVSEQDKEGSIILRVPYDKTVANKIAASTHAWTDLVGLYDKVTVDASVGATTSIMDTFNSANHILISEGTALPTSGMSGSDGTVSVDYGSFGFVLHSSFTLGHGDSAGAATHPADESVTKVGIYMLPPSETANITEITLTEEEELYKVANNDSAKITGVINHNNNTIRLNVPYSFNRDKDGDTIGTGTSLYLYDWEFNGEKLDGENGTAATAKGEFVYDLACLENQTTASHTLEKLVTLKESEITSLANVSKFKPARGTGNVITVWSEEDAAGSATQDYIVYAVRANASDESKLNSVGATAPVSVALDTKVEKLNRFIITVPENYDSAEGVNSASEFELSFADRSAHSTVKNGQTTWVGRGENTAKFKVVNGKLYFKNQPANLTDGRVIHFTVVAEDGTSTGAYEFEIRTTEPNNDATVSSVMVDDTLIFTQEGNNFVVKNLEDDENYDETKLPIIVNTTDPAATVTVDGKEYRFEWGVGSNITVDLSEGKTVPMVVTAADGKTTANYTLSMASSTVTPPDPWTNPFTDVKEGDWYYNAVKYVNQNGLMDGTSATKFSPRVNLTRAQFAQILYNAEGNPDVTWTDKFSDVKEGAWYAKAVIWAAENNVLAGYANGTARPNSMVTREDLVSLLWRYAGKPAPTGTTLDFSDASKVSSYAKDALLWAVENKIISGRANGELDPKGNAQRAEAAQMLMQYFSNK